MPEHSSEGLCVTISRTGSRMTVTLAGDLDLASAGYLRSRAIPESRAPSGVTSLEVDVSRLAFADVAGLAALVDLAGATTSAGGSFRLIRPSATMVRLIDLIGLADVLRPVGGDS